MTGFRLEDRVDSLILRQRLRETEKTRFSWIELSSKQVRTSEMRFERRKSEFKDFSLRMTMEQISVRMWIAVCLLLVMRLGSRGSKESTIVNRRSLNLCFWMQSEKTSSSSQVIVGSDDGFR